MVATQSARSRGNGHPQPLELSHNAQVVLERRYLTKDAAGNVVETPEGLFRRVARHLAQAERNYSASDQRIAEVEEQLYRLMTRLDFLPNSPTLSGAGRPLGMLSACFVLPVDDSLASIFETVKHAALVHQGGGGTGFAFSRLRPAGSIVRSTSGVASGPVSFMKVFDGATEAIKQGGCVVPETMVTTDRGIVPIRELGPVDAPADSWHRHTTPLTVATDDGRRVSNEFYHHGVAPIRRIHTRNGYHLAATLQHRVRVIDEHGGYVWRRLEELKPGDWVVLQKGHLLEPEDYSLPELPVKPYRSATPVRFPTQASEQFGEFIGYVVGDGAFNRYNHGRTTGRLILTVCDDQPDVAAWLLRTCDELFVLTPITNKKPDDGSTNFFLNATTLVTWLEKLGVVKLSAASARVPAVVFRRGMRMACGFLRGLFTADGTVSQEGYPTLCSVSRALIDDVQQLLLAVGIPSGVSVVTDRERAFGDRPVYHLRVITRAGLEAFAREIGFLDARRNALLANGLEKAWEFNDVIPHQGGVIEMLYAGPGRGSGPGRGTRGANRGLYRDIQHYLPGVAAPRNLTRSRLAVLAERHEEVRSSPLMDLVAHDQFYDQVESIEEGESLTLDLSVPANNTYIANGFVSHNTRRGANMGILSVHHPDIEQFVAMKSDMTTLQNFNISVAVSEKFMRAVEEGADFELIDPRTQEVVGTKNARELWDRLVANAWKNGDPGLIFIDRMNETKSNPVPSLGPIESTNPCGEQPLYPYDSCNLGSINLGGFVRVVQGKAEVDWDRLGEVVPLCVRFLDNVIDMNKYPLPQIEEVSRRIRRIGLGVMGWADMLYQLGIAYDSEEALGLAERVMRYIQEKADAASAQLVEERGPFPAWEESIYGPGAPTPWANTKLRNATRTTIAPTGTLSIIADCSGGIEPVFALAFVRQHYLDPKNPTTPTRLTEVNKHFEAVARREGFHSEELMSFLAEGGRLADRPEVPDRVKRVFVTAHEITPEWHVRTQAAFQRYVENAVSKTINFSNEATVADVERAYLLAYHEGCKGITIYRDGSREQQVLSHSKKDGEKKANADSPAPPPAALPTPQRRRLPDERPSVTHKFQVGEQEGYVTVGLYDDGRPGEVFLRVSKQGSTVSGLMESLGQLTSIALQYGVPLEALAAKMKNSRFEPSGMTANRTIPTATSLADYVFRWLERRFVSPDAGGYAPAAVNGNGHTVANGNGHAAGHDNGNGVGNGSGYAPLNAALVESGVGCPECGGLLHYAEGCMTCRACGYTKCG